MGFKSLLDIVNQYPAKRLESVLPYYSKKGNTVSHSSGSIRNPINNAGRITSQLQNNLHWPKPFGNLTTNHPNWKSYSVIETNLGNNPTQFRFFLTMGDASRMKKNAGGRTYISRGLKDDLLAAENGNNPYFTTHLIPEIRFDPDSLRNLVSEFNQKERIWGFEISDSLGTESGGIGEKEIVQYIDSLLYDTPINETTNEFQLPYRFGTVISSHLFSQNVQGMGEGNTDDLDAGIATTTDDATLAGLFDDSSVGSTPQTTTTQTRQVQADDGTTVNISGDTANLTDTQVANIAADVGFGPGTDDTTTGTTFVIDSDNDGVANSILNLNDDPNFETVFDPFGNAIGNNDTFGAAAILGGNRLQNLQTDLMNFNNQNNQTTPPDNTPQDNIDFLARQNQNNLIPLGVRNVGGAGGQYAPFGEPGEYSYQTRFFNGQEYIWNRMNSGKWESTFFNVGNFFPTRPF